ncbi:acyltransferase [Aneurinibacillus uraniidurans]|uniref:acyltransferase n=1 Tax=Aneurinibacillus uraniidurans TaxID=2966586 RepID=UPI00234A578E|nr:acyltransferase [Aneurinibacillus sp. B1]WCN38669.1 acyltransferase [Aneurinibacillus sp. B1]
MQKRLRELDWMRSFAALSVIMIHVTSGYVIANPAAYVVNQAMRYAVPLFIILSGFLLFYVDRNRDQLSWSSFYKKRFSKIVAPYLIWTVIYTLYTYHDAVAAGQYGKWLAALKVDLIRGTGFVHLYFLLIMVQLYAIYPLLWKWLQKHAASFLAVTFVVTVFSQTMIYFHALHIVHLPRLVVPYVILFPLWLFYFGAGMYVAKHNETITSALSGWTVQLGIMYIASFGLLLLDSHYTHTYDSSIKPTVMVYCFVSYAFFLSIAMKLKDVRGQLARFSDWLAIQSFLVFLLHPLVLVWIQRTYHEWAQFWKTTPGFLLLFGIVTAVSCLLVYMASWLRPVIWIGGIPRSTPAASSSKQKQATGAQ